MQNKVWMWRGKGIRRALGSICDRVWNGEGMLQEWRTGVIVPIAKKRGAVQVSEECTEG